MNVIFIYKEDFPITFSAWKPIPPQTNTKSYANSVDSEDCSQQVVSSGSTQLVI